MKILCIHSDSRIEAGADSAILRHGEPVFPAAIPAGWSSLIVPAIRLSRLGTSIKKTRAREYYDSFTLFHVLWPAAGSDVAPGIPASAADRTFSPGSWLPLSDGQHSIRISVRPLAAADAEPTQFSLDLADLGTDGVIARLSDYMTFKTGDILLFFNHRISLGETALDTEIKAAVDDAEVLSFRIK